MAKGCFHMLIFIVFVKNVCWSLLCKASKILEKLKAYTAPPNLESCWLVQVHVAKKYICVAVECCVAGRAGKRPVYT